MSRAWYGESVIGPGEGDIVRIGLYCEGGCEAEFSIGWSNLLGKQTPILSVCDDAWSALLEFQDVLQELAKLNDKDVDAQTIVNLLRFCGVEDMTKYERP